MAINYELLERVAQHIESVDPALFDMSYFTNYTDCGTTHCIGGWACALTHPESQFAATSFGGAHALGLDEDQANLLFYAHLWPAQFLTESDLDEDGFPEEWDKISAPVAAARIRHFAATEGRE